MVSRARRGGLATARKKKKMVVERAKYLGIKVPKRITSKYRKKVHSAFYRELKKQKATVTKVRKGWKGIDITQAGIDYPALFGMTRMKYRVISKYRAVIHGMEFEDYMSSDYMPTEYDAQMDVLDKISEMKKRESVWEIVVVDTVLWGKMS